MSVVDTAHESHDATTDPALTIVAPGRINGGDALLLVPILVCLGVVLFFFLGSTSSAAPDDTPVPVCRGSQLSPSTC